MSKFSILSAFILLCANLPGGLAGPVMVIRQMGEESRPVDAVPIEARQELVTSIVGGLTSIVGGVLAAAPSAVEDFEATVTSVVGDVTSVVGGVTSVIGGVLAAETVAPVPYVTASAVVSSQDLEGRQDLVTSGGGGLTSIVRSVLGAPAPSSAVEDLEARQAGVTSVVGGVTSVVGGVTSIIGGILAVETAAPVPASPVASPQDLDAIVIPVVAKLPPSSRASSLLKPPLPASSTTVEARNGVVISVGGHVAVETIAQVAGVTSVVGGVTSIVGGVTSVVAKAIPTPPVQQ